MGGVAMLIALYAQCYVDARREKNSLQLFPSIERGDRLRLIVVSVLGATLAPWLGIEGLGLTHGARASIWLALGPAISAVIGYLMRTESMGRAGRVGVILAGVGTLLLAYDGFFVEGYWLGDLLLCIALILTVIELHLIKPLAQKYGSISMVAFRTVIGGSIYIMIASPSLIDESWLTFGKWTWIAILAGGAIGVGIGQWVKVRALRTIGPTRVVIYGNLVPLAAILIAWVSVGQKPSGYEIASGLLIILGAISIQVIDESKRRKKHDEASDEVTVDSGASRG